MSYPYLSEKFHQLGDIQGIVENSKLYVGIYSVVIGLYSLIRGDFYADLIPSLLSICSGLILATVIFNYINLSKDNNTSDDRKNKIQTALEHYSTPIGLATLLFAIIHLIDIIAGGKNPII